MRSDEASVPSQAPVWPRLCLLGLVLAACGPKPLSSSQAADLIGHDPAFAAGAPELALTSGELTLCPLFFRNNGRVFPNGRGCDQVTSLAGTSDGQIVVTLPQKLARRVLEVKSLSSYDKAANERSAVVRWEWVSDPLGTELASCFDLSPREAMVLLQVKEGRWAVKDVLVEKLGVLPGKCAGR